MCQLELQKETASLPASVRSSDNTFDVSSNILLVPPFHESEVESYLGAFERLVVALLVATYLANEFLPSSSVFRFPHQGCSFYYGE